MPTTCEICPKPLWHMLRPPPAYECKRYVISLLLNTFDRSIIILFSCSCRVKIHKDHIDNNEANTSLAPCKLHHDPNSAREMLLLAQTNEDQQRWVTRLSKRIQKCGYKAHFMNSNNSTGSGDSSSSTKTSPR